MIKFDHTQHSTYLHDLLSRDVSSNHILLSYYLKLILSNKNLELNLPNSSTEDDLRNESTISIQPKELWNEILDWQQQNNINLVMGERGSIKTKASILLGNLEKNLDAARTAAIVRETLKTNKPIKTSSSNAKTKNLADFLELRRQTIDLYNKRVLGLASALEQKSKLIGKINDHDTRIHTARIIAGHAAGLKNKDLSDTQVADEVVQLMQHSSDSQQLGVVARLFYSDEAQNTEIDEIQSIINDFVEDKKAYPNETDFINSNREIAHLTHTLSINDIPTLIDLIAPDLSPQEQLSLANSLKSTIISSVDSPNITGENLLSEAIRLSGFDTQYQENIDGLAPFIEEIHYVEMEPYLGNELNSSNSRLLNTHNLARDTGVSSKIIWLSAEDLNYQKSYLEGKYGTDLESSLRNETSDFQKISEIREYFSNRDQYTLYRSQIDGSTLLSIRERIGKTRGEFAARLEPATRFYQKINKRIFDIDDFIHAPFRYITDKIEQLQEKNAFWYILTPGEYIGNKLTDIQLGVALWLYKKTSKAAKQTGAIGWVSRQINQYSKYFFKSHGDYSEAGFHFIQSKWGNLLNFSIKTISAGKYATTKEFRLAIAKVVMGAIAKASPELAAKFAANGLGKLIVAVIGGEMTMGASIAIQIGLEVISYAFKKIKEFIGNPEKFFNKLPIYAAVGAFIGGVVAIPSIILGGIAFIGSSILSGLAAAAGSIIGIFLMGGIWTIGIIVGGTIVFNTINTMTHLDSGLSSLVASVICDQSKQTSSNKTANVALCIADIVNKCPGLNPVTESKLKSSSWQCLVGGLFFKNAIAELEKSAHVKNSDSAKEGNLQCVGLSAASAADGDGGFSVGQINACSYAKNVPQGYRYLPGCPNMQPGDHFIMGAENCGNTVGHIGVVIQPEEGVGFTCVDANAAGPGVIQGPDKCKYAKSQISGCLRKI